MYLMYVDESGDCGLPANGSCTNLFCLSGLVVHELRWRDVLADLAAFRRQLWQQFRINIEDELHAGDMINKPSSLAAPLRSLRKHERLAVIRQFADRIAAISDISIINVVVDKRSGRMPDKEEVFRRAWYSLFQRFENTISCHNFPGPRNTDDRGIVFPDHTDGQKLKNFLDDMRWNNPLKVRHPAGGFICDNQPIRVVIEDPILRDSRESYFIQAADCVAYLLKQSIEPCGYMKKHGGNAYFKRMESVLCKHASRKDPLGFGVVRL